MRYFKFVENRFVFFIYSFFIGSKGIVFTLWLIVYSLFLPKTDFFNNCILLVTGMQILNRFLFNYYLVVSIEELEEGLGIIYLKYGMFKLYEFIPFHQIKVYNKSTVPIESGYWLKPVRIAHTINGKSVDYSLPKRAGLGLNWYNKFENDRFIDFAKEKGLEIID